MIVIDHNVLIDFNVFRLVIIFVAVNVSQTDMPLRNYSLTSCV